MWSCFYVSANTVVAYSSMYGTGKSQKPKSYNLKLVLWHNQRQEHMKEARKNVGITEDEEELWTDTETGEAWLWDGIYIIDVNGRRSCTKQMLCTQSETMKTTYVKSLFTKSAVRKSINQETKQLIYKIKKKVWKIRVYVLYAVS